MSSDKKQTELDILNIDTLNRCHANVRKHLDSACKSGLLGLKDAEDVIVSLSSLQKCITTLSHYQTYVKSEVDKKNKQKEDDDKLNELD